MRTIIGNGPLARPDFPQEGQTYYDQTSDSYVIYINNTWVPCDTHGEPIRVSTINIEEPTETTPTTPSKGTSKRKSKKAEEIQ